MEVLVRRVIVTAHENADNIELAHVDDYVSIVRKGDFHTGDLAVYIPEQAVVPAYLLEHMGLEGKLGGSQRNVVKAIKLRGVVSQGILLRLDGEGRSPDIAWLPTFSGVENACVVEGDNVGNTLGIAKREYHVPQGNKMYVPPVNSIPLPEHFVYHYDMENIKKYPTVFEDDEPVVVQEKIHGTFLCVMANPEGDWYVSSKGLLQRGFGIHTGFTANMYVAMALDTRYNLAEKVVEFARMYQQPVMFFGEIFGQGVQDLTYGVPPDFRMFDIRVGQWYMDYPYMAALCEHNGLPSVPVLYRGGFYLEIVKALTEGKERVSGKQNHFREGVVVKSTDNSRHPAIGRKILKSISTAYLLRKNGTEYN